MAKLSTLAAFREKHPKLSGVLVRKSIASWRATAFWVWAARACSRLPGLGEVLSSLCLRKALRLEARPRYTVFIAEKLSAPYWGAPWMAARKPEAFDQLVSKSLWLGGDAALSNADFKKYLSSFGPSWKGQTLGGRSAMGMSYKASRFLGARGSSAGVSPARPSRAAMSWAAGAKGWVLAVDEPLGASHPAVALAWLSRARLAESSGSQAAMESFAASLARSMSWAAGFDDLHSDYAKDCSSSGWGQNNIAKIMELGYPMARAFAESRELAASMGPAAKADGATRMVSSQ